MSGSADTAARLAAVHASAFAAPWDAAAFAALLDQAGVFVLEDPDGFILLRVVADEAEILTLAVSPAARRRGLGARLVREGAAVAAARGAARLFLEVAGTNAAALALYTRAGFTEAGRRPRCRRIGRESIVRVMVVGASTDRSKFGNKAVRAFVRNGDQVLPVNPRAARHGERIEGLEVFPDVASVPGPIDKATIYLPPELGVAAIEALAARCDVGEVWLNPGAESPAVLRRARELGLEPILACSIVAIGLEP